MFSLCCCLPEDRDVFDKDDEANDEEDDDDSLLVLLAVLSLK